MAGSPHRRWRRTPLIVALAGSALAGGVPAALADAPSATVSFMYLGPHLEGSDVPTAAGVANGSASTLTVGVRHNNGGRPAGAAVLRLTLPNDVQVTRVATVVPEEDVLNARWECAGQAPTVECRLLQRTNAQPYPLGSADTVQAVFYLRGGASVPAVQAGQPPVDIGTVTADLSIPTTAGNLVATATTPAQAVAGPLPPRIILSQIMRVGPTPAGPRTVDGFDLLVRNVGGSDAITTRQRPALVLDSVVKNLKVRGLTLTGRRWSCTKATTPTCTYRGTVAAGGVGDPLQVRWKSRLDAEAMDENWHVTGTVGFDLKGAPAAPSGAPPQASAELVDGAAPVDSWLRLRGMRTVTSLAVHATAPRGIEVLAGRSASSVRARITNIGRSYAPQVALAVRTTRGVSVDTATKGWDCVGSSPAFTCTWSSSLRPGQSTPLDLSLSAPMTERAVSSRLVITPLGRANVKRGTPFELPLRVLDPGDPQATPQLWFKDARGAFAQWRHGGFTKAMARDPFTYRIAVVNAGGDVLAPGTPVSITQRIGRNVSLRAVMPGPDVDCADGAVRCSITPDVAVKPGTTFATVQVTVTPRVPVDRADIGNVVTRVGGVPGTESLPMKLRVVDNPNSLRPSMRVTRVPTSGGGGALAMVVQNEAAETARDVRVVGTVPADIRVRRASGSGWSCTAAGRRLSCAYAGSIAPGRRTPGVSVDLTARGATATRPQMRWDATGISPEGRHQRGMRKGPLPIRAPLYINAEAQPRVLSASRDLSTTRRRVSLDGSKSAGNGLSIDYAWRQRCLTPQDVAALAACRGTVAPRARVMNPNVASTHAIIPTVSARTRFVFELSITDGSATRTARVNVTAAVPQKVTNITPRHKGASPGHAAEKARIQAAQRAAARQRASADATARTNRRRQYSSNVSRARAENRNAPRLQVAGGPVITAARGQSVALVAERGGRLPADVTYEWAQLSGTPTAISGDRSAQAHVRTPEGSGVLVYRVTARAADGTSASAEVMVAVDLKPSPQFQAVAGRAAKASRGGGAVPLNLGNGITGQMSRLRPMASASAVDNGAASSYSFSGSSFTAGPVAISGASGTVTMAGVEITAGTVTLPPSFGIGPMSVGAAQPLVLTFAEGQQPASLVGQVVDATSFALLPLPTGWSGSTTLTFGGSTWAIDATAVGDGTGSATMSGTLGQDGTYTVKVSGKGLVHVGPATIDVNGQLSNAGGSTQSTITGTLAAPVALAPGVSVPSLTATWSPGAAKGPSVTGTGVVQIDSGSSNIQLNAAVAYTSSQDWSLKLTGAGGASWSPVPGLALDPSDFSGSVGMAKGAWQWDIAAKVPRWTVTSVLTLNNLQLDLTNQCSGNSPPCPTGSMFFKVSMGATLDPPLIQPVTAQATAVIGVGSGGGFSLSADLGTITISEGISLTAPELQVTYDMPEGTLPSLSGLPSFSNSTEGGFSITATGGMSLPGIGAFDEIIANITSRGWSLGGFDPNGVSLGSGNGGQSNAFFGWSSFNATMTADIPGFGLQTLQLQPGTISVTGGYQVPEWFTKMTGGAVPSALGTIQFDPSNGFFNASISLPGAFNLPGGGSKMDAVGLSFVLQNNAAGFTANVQATVNLSVKGMDDGDMVKAPQLDLDLGFDFTTQTIEASLSFVDAAGWNDAFGVDGLTVNQASFTLSLNLDTMIPGLKLLASGALPESVTGPFAVPNQAQIPITVGAELSDTNPCVEFQVGSSTGTTPVLQVGGGVATANYFEFILAPDGCQLSPQSPAIPAGFQMAFDGSVLGTTVDVSASLELEPSTKFTANVDIGAFSLGGLQFQETKIGVSLDEGKQENDVSFSGGFTIFGNGVAVSGSLDQNGANTSASLTMSEVGTWEVEGFSLKNMRVTAKLAFGPDVEDIDISASGEVNILGQDVNVEQFEVQVDNGVVEDVEFDISTSIQVEDVATANGKFHLQYSESSGDFDLNAAVVLNTAAGFSIGTPAKPATLDISPQCAAFEGQLAFSPVFTATLQGTIAYAAGCKEQVQNAQGQMVTPQAGDFSFAASDVALTLGPFDAQGAVSIGDVGGVGYADVATDLKLSPQAVNAEVALSGSIQSNGNFSFNGSGTLDLAGFNLQMAVSASNSNGNVSVSGSAKMSIAGTTALISGSFSEIDGAPSTTLTGAIPSMSLGGYDVGNASITLTQTPQEIGVEASVAMQVGSPDWGQIKAAGNISFVENLQQPNAPLFYASLEGSMGVPSIGAAVNGALQFSDCTNSCTAPAPVQFALNGNIGTSGFTFNVDVKMSATGEFAAQASSGANLCSGTVNLVVIRGQACFDYQVNLFIGSSAPYGSLTASAGADIEVQTWDASPWYAPWKWTWGNWYQFGVNVGASVQLSPFEICVDVMGQDLCV